MQLFSNFASERESSPRGFLRLFETSLSRQNQRFQEQRSTKESHPRPSLSPRVTHTVTVSPSFKHILVFALQLGLQSTPQISTSAMFAPQKTSDWDLFPFQQVDVVFHFPLTLREPWWWGWVVGRDADEETARAKIGVKQ